MLKKLTKCSLFENTNWDRTMKMYKHICDQIQQNKYTNRYYEPSYKADIISLGENAGGVLVSHTLDKWIIWTGPLLETSIPWCKDLKKKFLDNNLNFVNYCFSCHYQDIPMHTDGKTEKEKVQGHCNINYVVDCVDRHAYTWSKDQNNDDAQKKVSSGKNTTMLLQTDAPHGVVNNGARYVFQIRFHDPYETINNFIETNPNIFAYAS